MDAGGLFIDCAGRPGGDICHADSACGCAAFPSSVPIMTVAPPVASPTPESLESQQNAMAQQTAIKRGDRLHGIASWYGGVFNGRKTASGERYDMFAMTACHPTLPFGSLVRVVNQTNQRSVVVRITDRGDLVDEGRIIDLSYGAAMKLAMTKRGLAKVESAGSFSGFSSRRNRILDFPDKNGQPSGWPFVFACRRIRSGLHYSD